MGRHAGAPLHQLTEDLGKRQLYTTDPLLREGWATLTGVQGAGPALQFASETAIVWLRPDVAAAGAIGAPQPGNAPG